MTTNEETDPEILAFDFGGTKLTATRLPVSALANPRPRWSAQRRILSPQGAGADFDIRTMIQLGQELIGDRKLAAVGVSFGGPATYATGVVRLSHHVVGWEDTPLQALLEETFAAPVRVDNDANVAALGEWRFGAARGISSLLYVTVSTGVGGGWILNGRPWRGVGGMAGEIGHTVIDPQGPVCLCGKRGCVERLASGPYMAQDYGAAKEVALHAPVTGETVAAAAAAGDEVARQILRRGAAALGVGIGNAVNLINPELVVLGGGVTKAGDGWWEEVRRTARATVLPEVELRIVPATHQDDTPLWGAVALVEALV